MDRIPNEVKLDLNRTFENQRESVNKSIIPVIQKSINKKTFPVTDGIIKHIIHEQHRHQRETFLNKKKSDNWNDIEKRRKHANSRRTDVSKGIGCLFIDINKKTLLFRNENAE